MDSQVINNYFFNQKITTHNSDCLNVDSQNDINLYTVWVYTVSNKLQC